MAGFAYATSGASAGDKLRMLAVSSEKRLSAFPDVFSTQAQLFVRKKMVPMKWFPLAQRPVCVWKNLSASSSKKLG